MAQDYNKTLNLPADRVQQCAASLPQREPGMLAEWNWQDEQLYQKMIRPQRGQARSIFCTTAPRTPTATSIWAPR